MTKSLDHLICWAEIRFFSRSQGPWPCGVRQCYVPPPKSDFPEHQKLRIWLVLKSDCRIIHISVDICLLDRRYRSNICQSLGWIPIDQPTTAPASVRWKGRSLLDELALRWELHRSQQVPGCNSPPWSVGELIEGFSSSQPIGTL
jgi:hypothetical protein